MAFTRVTAKFVEVEPSFVRGSESRGMLYTTWSDSPVVGAQCGFCNTIAWVNQRQDSILTEAVPAEVPESGEGYRRYADDRTARFLRSLPACPTCGRHGYDRFVNNVRIPRFPDGGEPPAGLRGADVTPVDGNSVDVYLLETKAGVVG